MTINVMYIDTSKAILHTTGNYSAESRIADGGQQKRLNTERVLIDDVAPYNSHTVFFRDRLAISSGATTFVQEASCEGADSPRSKHAFQPKQAPALILVECPIQLAMPA